jgi:hypothetical protein
MSDENTLLPNVINAVASLGKYIIKRLSDSKIEYLKERPVFPAEIDNAKHSIFISGGTTEVIHYYIQELLDLKKDIILSIAYADTSKPHVSDYMQSYFGKDVVAMNGKLKELKDDLLRIKKARNKKTFHEIPMDVFNPIAYFAIDYDSDYKHSVIFAKHYTISIDDNARTHANRYYLRVTPKAKELYNIYKEEINKIIEGREKKGKKRKGGELSWI